MSILIKRLKVHRRSCWECPCFDDEYGKCNVLKKNTLFVEEEDCPLIELSDQGDLIDKDELSRLVGESFEYFLARLGLKCPKAVIPAEKSEE